jgi:hypothetical protein
LASQAGSYVPGNSIAGSQIEIVDQMQLKVNELCMKIDDLECELNLKNGAVDRELKLHFEDVSEESGRICLENMSRWSKVH